MTGFVHVYLATGDDSIKSYALRRIDEIIDVQRANWHASKTLVMQGSHPLTGYPNPHKFFMPWQHGPVLYGFLAAHRFFGSSTALDIAKDVVPMIDYSWVTNVNDPTFGFVANGLRYYVPTEYQGQPIPADYWDNTPGIGIKWGDSPLGGAHTFLVSGLFLLADRMSDPALIQRAVFYGSTIMGPLNAGARWTKWNLLVVEGLVPP